MIADPDAQPVYERNPAQLTACPPDDLIRLAFDDTLDLPPSTLRWRLHTARHATLQRLEDAGQIVREPDGHGGERNPAQIFAA